MYHEPFMLRAIELSRRALTEAGTEPFGAVVVKDGAIVGEGLNYSSAHHDPTSHGEVEAIRDACRRLQTVDLTGCELYTSCEPCAMCVAAIVISGISRLYVAAGLAEAGRAIAGMPKDQRHPIDSAAVRAAAGTSVESLVIFAQKSHASEAVAVLEQWAATRRRG
jgi:guanine deaminase